MTSLAPEPPGPATTAALTTSTAGTATPFVSTLPYIVFCSAMIIGRFSGDFLAHRFGASVVIAAGGIVAGTGLTTGLFVGGIPAIMISWFLLGLGLSVVIPLMFSAAGTTGHGVGFVTAAKYQGTASAVSGNSLSVGTSAFTANEFGPSGGLASHYIQITSGSQAGLVVDITGNTGSSLSVASGDLVAVTGTPTFVIRPHIKVSSLFSGNAGLIDYTDTVTLY